jgi:hypothetical protein
MEEKSEARKVIKRLDELEAEFKIIVAHLRGESD